MSVSTGPLAQPGTDRYIQIKRKLSPLNSKEKVTCCNSRVSSSEKLNSTKRLEILADNSEDPEEDFKKKKKTTATLPLKSHYIPPLNNCCATLS